MTVCTRRMKQHAAMVAASRRELHFECEFNEIESITQLNSDRTYRPQVALAIGMAHISLGDQTFHEVLPLRTALNSMNNLTDLTLLLPGTVPVNILANVYLPRLFLFRSNIAHSKLVRFLLRHAQSNVNPEATLRKLCLGECGRRQSCALHSCALHTCLFDTLEEVECPLSCASALVTPSLTRLSLSHHSTTPSACSLFSRLAPLPLLTYLSIKVHANERGILTIIPGFAPRLYHLKIIQIGCGGAPKFTRSVIHDYKHWARMIQRLHRLNTLLVRVPWYLVRRAGDEEAEKETIARWLTGRRYRAAHCEIQNLQRIGMHYGPNIGGVLSHWRVDGEWRRYAYVNATEEEHQLL